MSFLAVSPLDLRIYWNEAWGTYKVVSMIHYIIWHVHDALQLNWGIQKLLVYDFSISFWYVNSGVDVIGITYTLPVFFQVHSTAVMSKEL